MTENKTLSLLALAAFSLVCSVKAHADEGMWMLCATDLSSNAVAMNMMKNKVKTGLAGLYNRMEFLLKMP